MLDTPEHHRLLINEQVRVFTVRDREPATRTAIYLIAVPVTRWGVAVVARALWETSRCDQIAESSLHSYAFAEYSRLRTSRSCELFEKQKVFHWLENDPNNRLCLASAPTSSSPVAVSGPVEAWEVLFREVMGVITRGWVVDTKIVARVWLR